MAVMDYRTQDGLAHYAFSIDFQPTGGWRAYIGFQPCHLSRADSSQLPFQSIDRNGRRYVHRPAKLDSLGDAKTVAALRAELVQSYQRAQEKRRAKNQETKVPERPERLRADAV